MKKRVISLLLCLLMALSLIPTTAFASDIATQGGNQNHIDVNISMEVEVNGKKQNLNLQRTDLANLTITNSLGKTFTLNNGFTLDGTSYDKYGNPQFRLVGNFPYTTNWGQEAVNYTLTLKKTIDGVPFEFAATVNIWGENNVCPGNGIDVAFGKGSQVEGVLQLTKVIGINSAALVANKEFTFTVTNKDNSSDVRTVTIKTTGTETTLSKTISLPAGEYVVKETTAASYQGYEAATVSYKVGTAEATNDNAVATITVGKTTVVTVTNTYAPTAPATTSVTVTKAWAGQNGIPEAKLPTSVTVKLLQNDAVYDTQTLTTGNWSYTWTGLSVKDANDAPYTYTVEEVPVPGYTSAVTGDAVNGFTITNTLNFDEEITNPGSLTIKKVNKEGIALPGAAFKLEKNGDDGFTPITGSTNDDGIIRFDTLTVGTYTLTETQAPEDYKLGTVKTWTVKVEAGTPYAEEVRDNDGNLTGYKKVTPCTVTVEGLNAASDIYSITNEAIEKTDITVTKVWYDMDNKFGLRPDSITVQLYTTDANGENLTAVTGKTLTLTAKNSWKGAFADLPQFNKDGSAIYYTVAEVNASDRYTSTVAKDNNGNFTITNTLMTGKLMIQKSLMDANGYIRADKDLTFTFDVYAKDADITKDAPVLAGVTVTVKAGDDLAWTVQPVQLPVGDYIVVERGAADKSVAAPSGYTYRFNDITYSAPQAKPDVNALAAADPTVPEFASIVADRITWADVNNCYAHDPYTVTIPVTKTVTKALNSIDPGKVTFTFKAQLQLSDGTWVDLACTNNTITLTGTGTKSTEMSVTIPSEYFSVMTPVVTLRIIEVNDGLPNWKYADNACEIKATVKDGAINLEYAGPVAFTNTYSYTYTPPRPRPNPKPVPSAKTGDMGIALYALTSLLSLSGTALVIKKRKDEE